MAFSQFLQKRPSRLEFQIDNVDLAYVNAFRRILLAEIPTVGIAFDPLSDKNPDLSIHVNTSSLHNEFLAHRISLLPLCFDENEVAQFDPSKYTFRLTKHNTGHQILPVTSRDIDILDEDGNRYPQELHSRVFPPHPITKDYMLITKLKPNPYNPEKGEHIDVTFRASINIAKTHSRWCPVSTIPMHNVVDEDLAKVGFDEKIQRLEAQRGKTIPEDERQMLKKRFDTLEQYRFFKKNAYDEANSFHFGIRSICALRPAYLMFKAIRVLRRKVDEFVSHLQTQDTAVTMQAIGQIPNFFEITIHNEDFTLLNVLQCITYNKCFREKRDPRLVYIGYHDPHPLDPKMILKVKFLEDVKMTEADVRSFFVQAAAWIQEDLEELTRTWIASSDLEKLSIHEVADYLKA